MGILFVNSALFEKTCKQILFKVNRATVSLLSLINGLNIKAWYPCVKLFNSLVKSLLLYASPVLCLRHLQEIDKVQINFFKKLLNLPLYIPNYAVRVETNQGHLAVKIFKLVLNWIENILLMSEDRLPKICFYKIKSSSHKNNLIKYNWASIIRETFFVPIEEGDFWDSLTLTSLQKNKDRLLYSYNNFLLQKDIERCIASKTLIIYPHLLNNDISNKYLNLNSDLKDLKIIAQIRLISNIGVRLIKNGKKVIINENTFCNFCGFNNDFLHIVCNCKIYSDSRCKISSLRFDSTNEFFEMLTNLDELKIKNLLRFIDHLIKKLEFTAV